MQDKLPALSYDRLYLCYIYFVYILYQLTFVQKMYKILTRYSRRQSHNEKGEGNERTKKR